MKKKGAYNWEEALSCWRFNWGNGNVGERVQEEGYTAKYDEHGWAIVDGVLVSLDEDKPDHRGVDQEQDTRTDH